MKDILMKSAATFNNNFIHLIVFSRELCYIIQEPVKNGFGQAKGQRTTQSSCLYGGAIMKEIFCPKCKSTCRPPMGISNTVVCADCGFIFEIIRGPLGSKIEENQSDEGSFDQPEFDSPEPLDQGTELEEKESEEREISKAKRSTGRINRNREEEKEEKSDKSDKKKRFALQRPDIIPSNTYAAPLKEIQKILEKEEPVKPKANVLPKQEPRVAPNFVPGNVSVKIGRAPA